MFDFSFSSLSIYKFIVSAIILFVFFRAVTYALPLFLKNKRVLKVLKRYFPLIEFILWILFTIIAFKNFLEDNQYFALALFITMSVIAIWASRMVLKDYIAGIILKTNSDLNTGDAISFTGYSGVINKFKFRAIEIESDDSEIIQIPSSLILENSIKKSRPKEDITAYTFNITVSKNESTERISEKIKQTVYNLPWTSVKKDPIINPVSETKNSVLFEITIFSMSKDYNYKIENHLKEKFSS